jgi:RimJ/RimL family protein N-acetyltransferase
LAPVVSSTTHHGAMPASRRAIGFITRQTALARVTFILAGQVSLSAVLDWTPARRPPRAPIAGRRVRLEPLEPGYAGDLIQAARNPELWRYLPYGPFADEADYADWIRSEAAGEDPLYYAIVDSASGEARGVASYLRIHPDHGTIEIGHIWLGAGLERTVGATEAMYLLARTAFDELGNRRLEWTCNVDNERSRRAAERLGFTFEGVFRQHQVIKGENRDTAWYALLDTEWPAAKKAFEAWLDAGNFDQDGRQFRSLAELR